MFRGDQSLESKRECTEGRFNCVRLFTTPRTVARQPPLSMRLSRQEYWSGLPFPSPEHLPDPGIKLASLLFLALASGFLTTSATWKARLGSKTGNV